MPVCSEGLGKHGAMQHVGIKTCATREKRTILTDGAPHLPSMTTSHELGATAPEVSHDSVSSMWRRWHNASAVIRIPPLPMITGHA